MLLRGVTVAAAVTLTAGSQASLRFEPISVADSAEFALVGDAVLMDSRLRLTTSAFEQVGAAWALQKQQVASGFQCTFRFQITNPGGIGGAEAADGFAFVIQNDAPDAIGLLGSDIGYGGEDAGGIPNSIAVEFDTYQSASDPNANHIAVQTRGTLPNSSDHQYALGISSSIPDLNDGNIHAVLLRYQSGSMTVAIDGQQDLDVPLDISQTLNLDQGSAWVGFTAATAYGWQTHDILDWRVGPVPSACDLDWSGTTDVFDLLAFLELWFPGSFEADFNHDRFVNIYDLLDFLDCWFAS